MKNIYSLLTAQILLKKAGSRLKLKAVYRPGENYFRFRVQGRRGISPKLCMPVIHRYEGASILSLLDETSSQQRCWLVNGQADIGMKQIAHYGDVGKAWFFKSKEELRLAFKYEPKPCDKAGYEAFYKVYDAAYDTAVVVIRDQHDMPEVVALPDPEKIELLHKALDGREPVQVGDDVEVYRDIVSTFGLGLCFGKGLLEGYMYAPEWAKLTKDAWLAEAAGHDCSKKSAA